MNEPTLKKRSGWKIAGIIIGSIALCLIVLFVWVSAVAGSKYDRMMVRVAARRAELKAADPARPTLRGAAEPGNAWDDYTPAIDAIKGCPEASKLGEIVRRGSKAEPEAGKTALAALAKAIEQLHRGAGRATSRYPYDWDKGSAMPMPHFSTATNTMHLLLLQARSLAEAGKGREAAGVLLDTLQFGRDLGADGILIGEMMGYAVIANGLEELRGLLIEGRFDKAALEDLERGLAALEPILPDHGRVLVNDLLLFGGLSDPSVAGAWGPVRLMYAQAVEQTTEMMERAAKADAVSWAEVQKVNAEIESEAKRSWNPITKMAVPSTLSTARNIRVRRAQIRMLRVALHRASTGELLDLDDPFGTSKLKTAQTEAGLKIWSVGPDGVDDGGVGSWQNEGKDLILELKK